MRSSATSAPYDRPWAVAGTFYPASAAQLQTQVDRMLDDAPDVPLTGARGTCTRAASRPRR